MPEMQEDSTIKCKNPACVRRVTMALYCCGVCADAHEGGYEIDDQPGSQLSHTEPCERRFAEYREKAAEQGWPVPNELRRI